MNTNTSNDKYIWLEEVNGEEAIKFAKEESEKATAALTKHPYFQDIHSKALEFFGSKEKIPYVNFDGKFLYNLWSDDQNVQGLLRRTTVESFISDNIKWETVVDLDKLSIEYNSKIVFKGLIPNHAHTKGLLSLSHGGSDANFIVEFDLVKNEILKDGFYLPESKGGAHWVDDNTIRIERNFGEDSVTTSGYARTVRELKRGQSLDQAQIIFEIEKTDMYSYSKVLFDGDVPHYFFGRVVDFYNIEEFYVANGEKRKLNLPTQAEDHGIINGEYIVSVKVDWNGYKNGDILTYNLKTNDTKLIYSPAKNESFYSIKKTKDGLYIIIDEDVKGRLYLFTKNGDSWKRELVSLPMNGALDFLSTNEDAQEFFITYHSYNRPSTYYYGKQNQIVKEVKTAISFFDHHSIEVTQNFVKSKDGETIPYFLVHKKGLEFNGKNPTILYGYGGFEITLKPGFSNGIGASWLTRGGVYVLSNIRGGGEYGPRWHQAALKNNRQCAYDDFFAIAEDLFKQKITSPEHLGAWGGSNGGLLMGVCYTMRPDLFKAINCMVPLLDMHRYHFLLAGASWMAEYGNPDDEKDGAYIRKISPYQNIKKLDRNPVMFLNTSTKDDRVHPGHARKFAAKLKELNLPYLYYENMVGGHAGASNFKETAFKHALDMCFFWENLK